jgi:hypothetical protein
MPAYHQMGFNSNNLVDLPQMAAYGGAIFSPINAEQKAMVDDIEQARTGREKGFEIVFDPQLYVPATERGKLKKWSYFPRDFDTADNSSRKWWASLNSNLAQAAGAVNVDAVCSPAILPKAFTNDFYTHSADIANELQAMLANRKMDTLLTVIVNLPELSQENRALEIASIISGGSCSRVYLILVGQVEPRRELAQDDELLGAMRLIQALEQGDIRVLVGFCSSDLLLWKAAGATACASGKFFNLRRFTRQRFEEPAGVGGGQLPYWFEENLLAFLREQDVLLARKHALFSEASGQNPFGAEILATLDAAKATGKKPKWLALSWRHFLYWFADVERRLADGQVSAAELLAVADRNWAKMDKARLLMVERPNDGSWTRIWMNALTALGAEAE